MKITASNLSFQTERTYEEQRTSKREVEILEDRISLNPGTASTSRKIAISDDNLSIKKQPRLFSRVTEMPAPDPEDQINGDPKMAAMKRMIESMTGKKIKLTDLASFQRGKSSSPDLPSYGSNYGSHSSSLFSTAFPNQPPDSSLFSVNSRFSHRDFQQQESLSRQITKSIEMPDIPVQKVRITETNSLYESENTKFEARGIVKNASGEEINFAINLEMGREFYKEERFQMTGEAVMVDPLVVNFGGTPADLTDVRFKFDLDSDGEEEDIPWLTSGSGFLVLDRNGDGVVNNGSELFGPKTGSGFGELAELDEDKNGWIDENDAAFEELSLWSGRSPEGAKLQSIKDAGLGAIAVDSAETLFSVKDKEDNSTLGQIRRTGIYLEEDGKAGTIQQIDLSA